MKPRKQQPAARRNAPGRKAAAAGRLPGGRRFWHQLFAHSPDVVMVIDRRWRIAYANRPLASRAVGELLGTNLCEHLPEEDCDRVGAVLERVFRTGDPGRYEVSFPDAGSRTLVYESRLVPINEVAELLGGEEASVGGIYVDVQGDLLGGILLVLPLANLLEMDDLIHGRPPGTTTELAGVDLSAMCEMGNILAASFINTMADSTDLAVTPAVPEISVDMCLPVIDSVLAHFNQPGDEILITEAVIYGSGSENVVCHLLLFLEPDSLRKFTSTLEGEPASRGGEQG